MPAREATPFARELDRRVAEGALGTLYERLPDNRVRCVACGHRCLILDGLRGICKVRYNRGGTLMVPHGYVGALQCDPIEKKPFFHAFPGTDALTFGMLGCDLHCSYCFTAEARVATSAGLLRFDDLWERGCPDPDGDPDRRTPHGGLRAACDDGEERPVRWIFRHAYAGELVTVAPRFLPSFEMTPDHPVLATTNPGVEHPEFVPARQLTERHYLIVPRPRTRGASHQVDVAAVLRSRAGRVKVSRHLPIERLSEIMTLTAAGVTSAAIGTQLGLRADHVRHVRSRFTTRGAVVENMLTRPETVRVESGLVRFGQERRPGIPAVLPLTLALSELLGYYCAEGGVSSSSDRPNSHTLVFAFGPDESVLADRCTLLLKQVFGVSAYLTKRETTLAVSIGKSSLGVLFAALCGSRSWTKRVPAAVSNAAEPVVRAFLRGYVMGDGHRYANGKTSVTTVSEQLAWDVAWLALRLGFMPSVYRSARPSQIQTLGRTVNVKPWQYTVVWYEAPVSRRYLRDDDHRYYVPIRGVTTRPFQGAVYNLEIDGRHTYLANLAAVHNCQNWVTSQALRDPGALAEPMDCAPAQLVDAAVRQGAKVVATSYNEPLITSEWAVDVFKEAKRRGFRTAYISNGNATREVLAYIRPWTDLYKIDLKSMRDRNYRTLGGKLENILEGIRMVHAMGFWIEIVTLVIPGFNDSDEELGDAARFLAAISPTIPWHVTAFHKDYKMQDPDNTTARTLLRAARIGEAAGLQYVYAGNLPGQVGEYEDTRCPRCRTTLIRRIGYRILADRLTGRGVCAGCDESIPGVWR